MFYYKLFKNNKNYNTKYKLTADLDLFMDLVFNEDFYIKNNSFKIVFLKYRESSGKTIFRLNEVRKVYLFYFVTLDNTFHRKNIFKIKTKY